MHGQYFLDYTSVLIAAIVGFGMVLISFMAAFGLAPRAKSTKKETPYECGIEPTGNRWSQIHVRYYIFGIMFLIFSVEAVFLFPWAVVFMSPLVTSAVFYEMIVFLGILFFGLLYGWKKGALQWK